MNNEELWKLNEEKYLVDNTLSKIKDIMVGIVWGLVYLRVIYLLVIWRFK